MKTVWTKGFAGLKDNVELDCAYVAMVKKYQMALHILFSLHNVMDVKHYMTISFCIIHSRSFPLSCFGLESQHHMSILLANESIEDLAPNYGTIIRVQTLPRHK